MSGWKYEDFIKAFDLPGAKYLDEAPIEFIKRYAKEYADLQVSDYQNVVRLAIMDLTVAQKVDPSLLVGSAILALRSLAEKPISESEAVHREFLERLSKKWRAPEKRSQESPKCGNCCGIGYFGMDTTCRECGGTGRIHG